MKVGPVLRRCGWGSWGICLPLVRTAWHWQPTRERQQRVT